MIVSALSGKEISDNLFEHIVDPIMGAMALVAILLFAITAIKLIRNADSVDRKDLFTRLGWSIFGIFIIVSVWTIIAFVGRLAESNLQIV